MNAIFDTNSVYYLDSKLSKTDFEQLIQIVADGGLKIFISPIIVIEMASRLKEKPTDFKKVQNAIKKLLKLNPVFLPDPEQQLAEYIRGSKLAGDEFGHWKEIFYTIGIAPNVSKLEAGFDDLSTSTRRSVNLTHIHSFRKAYETYYVLDMETPLKSIVKDFDIKIFKGKNTRLPKEKVSDFNKYLKSANWINQIKLMLINRTLLPLPNNQTQIDTIFKNIYFFKKSYEDLFVKIFQDGYIPNMKKKNDYNDWHFNVYFNDNNDYVFITSENNVVFKELRAKSRCMDICELIK